MFNFFLRRHLLFWGFPRWFYNYFLKPRGSSPSSLREKSFPFIHTRETVERFDRKLCPEGMTLPNTQGGTMKWPNSQGGSPDLNWLCPLDSRGHTLPSPVLLLSWLQSGRNSRVEEENTGEGDVFRQADLGRVPFAVFMKSKFPFLELKIKQLS